MPCIRRLILCTALLAPLLAIPAMPGWAQSLASTDLLPVQAAPGAPPPAASTPAQPRTPEATPAPSSGGGYQCERSRPTS